MFMGEYQHSIDAKGRISFPAKFREQLGQAFVATKGQDGCLFIFSTGEWRALEAKLEQLPTSSKHARAVSRFFFSGATELECDKLGRVLLPAKLREHAGLCKEATVIGAGRRVEIWDSGRWDEYNEKSRETVDGIEEELTGLGI
ncbi:MAG: division/cell wall cluster transcriptional repressor MraZ [Acidaminococcales bacterium]|jgi:MraZ protein|nr:division/cell wall cluster transcriptional repressor MraZ [Acidaminococcales bacterium]